jgi:hypothetical protein
MYTGEMFVFDFEPVDQQEDETATECNDAEFDKKFASYDLDYDRDRYQDY